ncbi:UDP-N-acetylglucosamine transferase subunit ALG14 homolog isoform X4 [Cricetulus griseus]|uniref:UDP-N-acetylglucosamine transferase subunit ALG14 homolog isoform X4 n=1 Tax=Cricetulus griseus TaxID=10029 RepID=UPI0007DA9E20|nr:UDP-N-acetylglucosamine transferase subunit ALG14 homolog isoform X4 [Cricetulus griseus]
MVSLLILAAAAATVVILLLVVRLWAVIRPLHVVSRESLTPLIVAGSGGHTTEILRLVGSLSGAYSPRHYVIADSDEMSAKKIESFEHARTKRDSPPEASAGTAGSVLGPWCNHTFFSKPQHHRSCPLSFSPLVGEYMLLYFLQHFPNFT